MNASPTLEKVSFSVPNLASLVDVSEDTIRKAIEKDPASVPLLVGQLEQGRSSAGMLVGVILLVGGVALGVAGLFEESGERIDVFQIAAIAAVLGAGAITYKLVQGRDKPRE